MLKAKAEGIKGKLKTQKKSALNFLKMELNF